MQSLKYYVLGTKNSPLLKEYLEKYYNKLLKDLESILLSDFLKNLSDLDNIKESIKSLLKNKNNKNFILNGDISSLINSIILNSEKKSIFILVKEINLFLNEGIESENLTMNLGTKIAGTNIKLTCIDNNPYNKEETHPEHIEQGVIAGSWGEKSHQEWLRVYEKTFGLLKKLDPGIYDELNENITKIVPLGTARNIHNSASYKECVGHLYMGYTIETGTPEINNLEAIIHESSHNKLNLLMHFDPIILNDKSLKYYSAIRPDARHIHGVFLGYHAFAPTMYIIMKAYLNGYLGNDTSWTQKIVLYYIKTKFLQKVIKKYAIFTDLGKEVLEEIDYVIRKMDILFKKLNPDKDLVLKAKKNQMEHFNSVNLKYPQLEY